MSDWKNRTVYKEITQSIMDLIPDDQLAWAMFDHIWLKVNGDYKRTPQILAEMPPGFKVIYHL